MIIVRKCPNIHDIGRVLIISPMYLDKVWTVAHSKKSLALQLPWHKEQHFKNEQSIMSLLRRWRLRRRSSRWKCVRLKPPRRRWRRSKHRRFDRWKPTCVSSSSSHFRSFWSSGISTIKPFCYNWWYHTLVMSSLKSLSFNTLFLWLREETSNQ